VRRERSERGERIESWVILHINHSLSSNRLLPVSSPSDWISTALGGQGSTANLGRRSEILIAISYSHQSSLPLVHTQQEYHLLILLVPCVALSCFTRPQTTRFQMSKSSHLPLPFSSPSSLTSNDFPLQLVH